MVRILLNLFLSGLLFGSGPCIASCGPILISYIAGTKKNISNSLLVYLLFSLGRVFVYISFSILIYSAGVFFTERFLGNISKYTIGFGGLFIIVIGLFMILGKRLEFKSCRVLEKKFLEEDKKTIITLGLVAGLIPCAPLLAILSYIGLVSKTWMNSLLYSLSFGLGTLLSPLILLVLLAGLIPRWLKDKNSAYNHLFNIFCGIVIVILGVRLLIKAF
jgi:sulfite exporter TauE/SafE